MPLHSRSRRPGSPSSARERQPQKRRTASGREERRLQQLAAVSERLEYQFQDIGLLDRALTHSSAAHENLAGVLRDNETFEFLGDAVIAFATADVLHRRDPEGAEGRKSRLKALLVSEERLAERAQALGLPEALRLGRGEEKTGGRHKRAIWADAYEAVVAAIYLDGGIKAAHSFVATAVEQELAEPGRRLGTRDPKSALQELLQARGEALPGYDVVAEEGPAHRLRFRIACRVAGETLAEGEGHSKKEAEQAAARGALAVLRPRGTSTD
jgi:ribonuclease III